MNRKSIVKTLLMAVAVTACSESGGEVAAPTSASPAALLWGADVRALELVTPRLAALSGTETIGPRGGTISVGPVKLRVPEGALSRRTEITVTVPAGNFLQVDLQPHGLQFNRGVRISMDLDGTRAERNPSLARNLVGVYFEGDLDARGVTNAKETFDVNVSDDELSFRIHHFSGYCVVSGMDANDRCSC